MSKKISRVYNTLTYLPEKKILDYFASIIYRYFKADNLSLFALFGAFLVFYAYLISGKNIRYLHIANLGIIIHWFGDSLDGRVAKLRGESRPNLGHYLDHILDSFSASIIFIGIALSPIATALYWLIALSISLLLLNHVYLKTSVTGVFKLSINKIGGTEVRIMFVLFNLLIMYTNNPVYNLFGRNLFLTDVLIIGLSFFMTVFLLMSVAKSLWGKNKIKEE